MISVPCGCWTESSISRELLAGGFPQLLVIWASLQSISQHDNYFIRMNKQEGKRKDEREREDKNYRSCLPQKLVNVRQIIPALFHHLQYGNDNSNVAALLRKTKNNTYKSLCTSKSSIMVIITATLTLLSG